MNGPRPAHPSSADELAAQLDASPDGIALTFLPHGTPTAERQAILADIGRAADELRKRGREVGVTSRTGAELQRDDVELLIVAYTGSDPPEIASSRQST